MDGACRYCDGGALLSAYYSCDGRRSVKQPLPSTLVQELSSNVVPSPQHLQLGRIRGAALWLLLVASEPIGPLPQSEHVFWHQKDTRQYYLTKFVLRFHTTRLNACSFSTIQRFVRSPLSWILLATQLLWGGCCPASL